MASQQTTSGQAGIDPQFRQQVIDTICAVLPRMLELDGPVTADMRLREGLGLSSQLGLELLLDVEEKLDIQVDIEFLDPDEMKTVADLGTFIAGHYVAG
jgi:acyl carrier protein